MSKRIFYFSDLFQGHKHALSLSDNLFFIYLDRWELGFEFFQMNNLLLQCHLLNASFCQG